MPRLDSRDSDQRIPITLLNGFLGAGKTTLINHLLSDLKAGKIAVIVNEFGEIGIDNELIVDAKEDTIMMSNGPFIVITIAGSLTGALVALIYPICILIFLTRPNVVEALKE